MSENLEICGPVTYWDVTLEDGTHLNLTAHGYSETESTYDFEFLLEGNPRSRLTIAKIPKATVQNILGG